MKKLIISALLAVSAGAWAQGTTAVKVEDAWVRGTVAQQKATGAFMRITADKPARLVGAQSSVAGVTEVHEMSMQGDVMKMRQVSGIDLEAGKVLELKPGGYHVMLMDLKAPVKAGDTVSLTLEFEDAAKQRFTHQLEVMVRALNAKAPGAMNKDMQMGHGEQKHKH